jgi:tRNA threonylcarbamoyladenosine biosynthesis protein TsaE
MTEAAEAVLRFHSSSEEDTLSLGRTLGALLVPGLTVLLSGELGTGKTVLVRGVGDALGVTRVRSPSFTLVNEYRTEKFLLAHADLYRLEPGGAGELGLEEFAENAGEDCVLFVEWPDRWPTPPDDVLNIAIEAAGETERLFQVSAGGEKAGAVCRALTVLCRDFRPRHNEGPPDENSLNTAGYR